MKYSLTLLFSLFASLHFLLAQPYIDYTQLQYDKLDGEYDDYIQLSNDSTSEAATYTFLTLVDSIQTVYFSLELENQKDEFPKNLYVDLKKASNDNWGNILEHQEKYLLVLDFLTAVNEEKTTSFLRNNKDLLFSIIPFIYEYKESEQFLTAIAEQQPQLLFSNYKIIKNAPYAADVLSIAMLADPLSVKKYLLNYHPIFQTASKIEDERIAAILKIDKTQNRSTKSYAFLERIVNQNQSIDEADSLYALQDNNYFEKLLNIRSTPQPLAYITVDRELGYEALRFVRPINSLHEIHDAPQRFASVKDFSVEEMYTLIVYSEEEIFTSTFNGIFERLLAKMEKDSISGYELIEKVGFNRFRKFIKMTSNFSALPTFLATMDENEQKDLLQKFIAGIHQGENQLEEAVNVADAMGSINAESALLIIEKSLKESYQNTSADEDKLMYGLLIKLFAPKAASDSLFFDSISTKYTMPPLDKISIDNLLGEDSVNTQVHYFYDDDDGVASFASFLSSWQNSNWEIHHEEQFVIISSRNGNAVKIFANKPVYETTAWDFIQDTIKDRAIDIVVHRGHSFYVDKTINQISATSKLVVLGSCGGYHRLTDILENAPDVHIISTKQIGSQHINNPILYKIANHIRKDEMIDWELFWSELAVRFPKNSKTGKTFQEYVPPHQNLGARFVQAYYSYEQ